MQETFKKKKIPHSLPTIGQIEANSLEQTITSEYVGIGTQTKKVCLSISQILNKEYTFFVNSGTSALFLSLKAIGIKKCDEVILPNYSCPSLFNQIINCEATPVIIDSLNESFFVDVSQILQRLTTKTKAIIVTHPFGHYDDGIQELKNATNIPIIEDITHSIMAKGKMGLITGQLGDITISSLGSTKFITSGTGGFLSMSSPILAQSVSVLLDYDYNVFLPLEGVERYNMQLGDLNANLLLAQLEQLPLFINKRREIAHQYFLGLENSFPVIFNEESVYFRFFVKYDSDKIKKMRDLLLQENIFCAIGGVKLVSDIKETGLVINSKKVHQSLLSIPIYPSMGNEDINAVIGSVNKVSKLIIAD